MKVVTPPRCGSGGFGRGILRHARLCDVLAVAKVQMDVDHAGQYGLARNVEGFFRVDGGVGREDRRDPAFADGNVGRNTVGFRQHDGSAADHQIEAHRTLRLRRRMSSRALGLKSAQRLRNLAEWRVFDR